MKKISVVFLLVICMFAFAGCFGEPASMGKPDLSVNMTPRQISVDSGLNIPDLVQEVTPAVVGISASTSYYESVGSGVAIADGGYILTNHHVVSGANKITVYFANKTSAFAELIWDDSAMDIAIIKTSVNMPYLEMLPSENLNTGEDVIAIGTPLTLQFKHTVTRGIVSALNRVVEISNNDGTYNYLQNLIQHDASINPGNSGGPLINMKGQVIGINTLKVSDAEGLGFAIPTEPSAAVIKSIASDGTYKTPYLGIYGFDATIAQFYGRIAEDDGVYLLNVESKGPAGSAGLKEGDVIVKIGDKNVKTMLDLRTAIYSYEAGDKVEFVYLRGKEERRATVNLINK